MGIMRIGPSKRGGSGATTLAVPMLVFGLSSFAACGPSVAPAARPVVVTVEESAAEEEPPETPPEIVRRLVAGQGSSCVLVGRRVYCWGTVVDSAEPKELVTLRGAASISGEGALICALVDDGMRCAYGPKDHFEVDLPDHPVDLAVKLAVGCAALRNGEVHCWDEAELEESIADMEAALNEAFDEGDHEGVYTETYLVAKKVEGIQSARELVADDTTVCARGSQGVLCFSHRVPDPQLRPVAALREVARGGLSVGAGRAFALRPDGAVATWRTTEAELRADAAESLKGARRVAIGGAAYCAIASDGKASCNVLGGEDEGVAELVASAHVGALGELDDLAVGERHACALRGDAVFCWGAGDFGEIGVAVGLQEVPELRAKELIPFALGTCAITGAEPVCWGRVAGRAPTGSFGALATPQATGLPKGRVFEADSSFCALQPDDSIRCGSTRIKKARAVGERNDVACIVLGDGRVVCWRHGRYGSEAVAKDREPSVVEGVQGAVGVAVGRDVACTWDQAGAVTCWGADASSKRRPPALVAGLSEVVDLTIRNREVCGRTRQSRVVCSRWPEASIEDLGVSDVEQVVAGTLFVCARRKTGEILCRQGERGPLTPVTDAGQVQQIVAGAGHACVRHADGRVACWGQWEHGQLGSRPPWVRSEPVSITLPKQ